jgi:hypothetical protein
MRRSMAELAPSLQRGAAEGSPVGRPPATQEHSPATSLSDNASVTINTSQDYASEPPAAGLAVDFSSETIGQPWEQEIESGVSQKTAAEAAQEYREKAFKLMTAHVKANLQYAHRLTRLTTPFDFIELSTNHAQKQFELIMSQTVALGELSRSLTIVSEERWPPALKAYLVGEKCD